MDTSGIELILGDITHHRVDAIIAPVTSDLEILPTDAASKILHDAGAAAVHDLERIRASLSNGRSERYLDPRHAIIGDGGTLGKLVYTVSMDYVDRRTIVTPETIYESTTNALRAAQEHGSIAHLSVPLLGIGVDMFSPRDSAREIYRAALPFVTTPGGLKKVDVFAHYPDDFELAKMGFGDAYRSGAGTGDPGDANLL